MRLKSIPATTSAGSHAIVIGGSMAGLLSARVLADHVERVTILDRDYLPEQPAFRAGVPHARHVHLLLQRGREGVERLLPGFERDLIAAGAGVLDMADDLAWHTAAGWAPRFRSGLTMLTCSRLLLESVVRQRVRALPNVTVVERLAVTGLLPGAGDRVAGVLTRPRDGANGADEPIAADLIVDASGRHSRAPEWLSEIGYAPPAETVVNAHPGYASRLYEPAGDPGRDWRMILIQPSAARPGAPRAGILVPIEGGRWLCSLVGMGGDYAPTEDDAFLEFARSLASPLLFEAIRDATPVSPVHGYREIANQRRHYDQLDRQPENFLVTGDAACAFNPVYAQGMTTAVMGAEALAACLGAGRDARRPGLSRRFQRRLAKVNAAPWLLATGDDFRLPTTDGGRPNLASRLTTRYLDRVLALSMRHLEARRSVLEVFSMLQPPRVLFAPAIAGKVLRAEFSRRPASLSRVPAEAAASQPA